MYLKDQIYMSALSQEGSLTKAAARLHISQPAMSKWFAELELQIGQTLAVRTKNGLIFTEAGQIYLKGCQDCLETALEIRRQLEDLSQKPTKQIILGGSPMRGAKAFAKIFLDFHSHYPDIDLQFYSGNYSYLKKRLTEGFLTMALLGAPESTIPDLEYLKFMDEELLIMLPKNHPLSYDYHKLPPNTPLPTLDLYLLKDTPLLANHPETSYSNMVTKLYQDAGLESNIIFRSNIIPLLYEMVLNGIGAAMIPDSYYNPEDGISVYSLSPKIVVYQGIGIRSGHPLSAPEEYLIHLLMNSWGAPYYMHQYADYYLNQRKQRINTYEYDKI